MHTLHSLPFHLEYDGEAQVSKGFPVTADEQDSSKFTASFRGRKLTGSIVPLPEDLQSKKCAISVNFQVNSLYLSLQNGT